MNTYVVAVLCVVGLAIGQILFKASAASLAGGGSIFAAKTAAMFLAAMGLYATTSVAWVWVLQKVELGRIYPLMALAFILVPLGSYFVFGERLHPQYFVGLIMIIGGILIIVRS